MAMCTLLKTINFNPVLLSKHIKIFAFTDYIHSRGITRHLLKGPSLLPYHGASAAAVLSRNSRPLLVVPVEPPTLRSKNYQYRELQTASAFKLSNKAHIMGDTSSNGRTFSSTSKDSEERQGMTQEPPVSTSTTPNPNLSTKEKLKQAVKDYGSTVLVFHITMSLASLGFFYVLVSSGLDVAALLQKIGIGQAILESKLTQGASTFVVAYAIHKVFAPVRITITLTATPFIVNYLRRIGVLKIKPAKKD